MSNWESITFPPPGKPSPFYAISYAARALGRNYRKGKLTLLTVGDGRSLPVYEHSLKVKFSGHEFLATIGFSSRLGVGFNLLGREDFFEKFRICFNDRDKVLETTFLT